MKKIYLIIILALIFTLAACGKETPSAIGRENEELVSAEGGRAYSAQSLALPEGARYTDFVYINGTVYFAADEYDETSGEVGFALYTLTSGGEAERLEGWPRELVPHSFAGDAAGEIWCLADEYG
ncbi:MAG: hypothetical protein Q4B42_05535, partial [Oscillospiraceae bacterium]|nr:hypothetical protein [Oscillospiraceae bacterium]